MRTKLLTAAALLLTSSVALANEGPPPKEKPAPTSETVTVISGLAASLAAVAVGAWLLRRISRPGG
jgi:hypothetical protein